MSYIAIWIICGIAAGYIARQKNRDVGSWVVLSLLLGPFALLMVACSRTLKEGEAHKSFALSRKPTLPRLCPYCAEEIKPEAIVCKHCGRDVPAQVPNSTRL